MANDFSVKWTIDNSGLKAIQRALPKKLDQFGRMVATEMVGDVKLSFGRSPSPPGGPPGVDTGALRASIRWQPDGHLRWRIGDGVAYGVHLEFGTRNMDARPWLTPIFMQWATRDFNKAAKSFNWETGIV